MLNLRMSICYFMCLTVAFVAACQEKAPEAVEIKHYPLESMEGLITQSGVKIDKEIPAMAMALCASRQVRR